MNARTFRGLLAPGYCDVVNPTPNKQAKALTHCIKHDFGDPCLP
jgi:hypothetical protein